jgi:radical SAM protein (TIGR04043 family)
MVPVHTRTASESPFTAEILAPGDRALLRRDGTRIGRISLPHPPRFYGLATEDGVPYWKIAQLHAGDVLASTVLQTCTRYGDVTRRCQFCAIGESLSAGRTIARKSPEQLAEVAEAAERLDRVRHMVLTTGTPASMDRGAKLLCNSVLAIRRRTQLPIQAQCEPPDDFAWFSRLREAGVDSLGLHLEAWDQEVRLRIMPGKAEVPIQTYLAAFEAAVSVFGHGQVSSYLLAGLGDTTESLLQACATLIDLGVYPFVVPFVPITGTPLADHPAPSADFLRSVLGPLSRMLRQAGLSSKKIRAGCGKCGACSPLSSYES